MTEALLNDLGDLGLDPDARPPPVQVEAPPSPPPDEFMLMPELQAPPTDTSTSTLSPPATPTPPKSPTIMARPPRQSGKVHSELKEPPRSRNPSGEIRVSSVSNLMNSDPRLLEIHELFGGRWILRKSDPYDEYLKSLGIGYVSRKLAANRSAEMEFRVEGKDIHISVRSQDWLFKLDETVVNLVDKTRQSVLCTYGDGKLIQEMKPLDGGSSPQRVQRRINDNGEQEVIYQAKDSMCRRYYERLPDICDAPPSP